MRTLYLVQQIYWAYDDQWNYQDGAIPQKAFVNRDAAEIYRSEKENEARDAIVSDDPGEDHGFWSQNLETTFGGYENITTLPRIRMDEELAQLGIAAFGTEEGKPENWNNGWWRNLWASARTEEKRAAVWSLFDKVRFYEVVEVEAEV